MKININRDKHEITKLIRYSGITPYKTGKLKFNAIRFSSQKNKITITYKDSIAPYIDYLEYGTEPHDIPFAFIGKGNWKWWYPYKDGVPFLFGMGGRFNGKFHPGSKKHKGFIANKTVNAIIEFYKNMYKGDVR